MDIQTQFHGISCEKPTAGPCGVVLFGATGDLARKKVLPALFRIFRDSSVPESFFVLGFGRSALSDESFRERIRSAIGSGERPEAIARFLKHCSFLSGSYEDSEAFEFLKRKLEELHSQWDTLGRTIFHLAVPPELFAPIGRHLGLCGLGSRSGPAFRRLMVEKPFGRDLMSAKRLNTELLKHFRDEDIYRIDHYLGKNTVQNILVFRFANAVFEPVWNRRHIDHIQISFSETEGLDARTGFFDSTGLMRDVLQNHILQLLSLATMEPPASFKHEHICDAKARLFRSLRIRNPDSDIIRGQYAAGSAEGQFVPSYAGTPGVRPDSTTETWFAAKLFADNSRWKGVPFYIRGGKRLDLRHASISVVFKRPPYCLLCKSGESPAPNVLTFSIHPDQGVSLSFQAKVPGSRMCFAPLRMEFDYTRAFGSAPIADYDTLLLDCINGDQSLFWRKDGVETVWRLLGPALSRWDSKREKPLLTYPAGSSGPPEAEDFIRKDGRDWI